MARVEKRALPQIGMRPIHFAEWYVTEMGWKIIPLGPLSKLPLFPSPHPKGHKCKGECGQLGHGVYDATSDLPTVQQWWTDHPTANIGLAVPEGCIAVDADGKKHGPLTLRNLEQQYGALPDTVTNLTGSGNNSAHYLLTVPRGTRKRGTIGKGLDIKNHPGGYLVVPPSLHPETAKAYTWRSGYDPEDTPIAPAPAWLLEKLSQPSNGHSNGNGSDNGDLKDVGRNVYLTSFAGKLRRLGNDGAAIYVETSAENLAQFPDDPLPDDEVRNISYGMERYDPDPGAADLINIPRVSRETFNQNTAPPGQSNSHMPDANSQPLAAFAWYATHIKPFTAKNGKVEANNTTIMAVLENHPDWHGHLWWDDMTNKLMRDDAELTDASITELGAELGYKYQLPVHSDAILHRCLLAVCQQHKRDPLQHWLNSLGGWDGEKRLETWLTDCAGVALNDYHRFCSRNLIVSMIARAFDPGCICRSVLILEGPEEYRKSTFVMSLAPKKEWVDEISASLDGKEAHMLVQGLWVAELGELASLGRTEEARLKSFISMRVDAFIPKFKSFRVQNLRRTIFVGTTNKDVYFKDTGNTRFLPVRVMQSMDIEGFIAIREQLFAEAMLYYHDNPDQWWRMDAEATAQAGVQREQRRQTSWIEDDLADWLKYRPNPHRVTLKEIATAFYGLESRDKWTDINRMRQTADALRALGFEQKVAWDSDRKKTVRFWERDPLTTEA